MNEQSKILDAFSPEFVSALQKEFQGTQKDFILKRTLLVALLNEEAIARYVLPNIGFIQI